MSKFDSREYSEYDPGGQMALTMALTRQHVADTTELMPGVSGMGWQQKNEGPVYTAQEAIRPIQIMPQLSDIDNA